MKNLYLILILLMTVSCGKKKSGSQTGNQSQSMIQKEEFHEFSPLGVNFARLSSAQDSRRPLSIYCSNTSALNHEKAEKLTELSHDLQTERGGVMIVDYTKIRRESLISLIDEAIKVLQSSPYTSKCPKIYLAVQVK